MEEKVFIKSKRYKIHKFVLILLAIGAIVSLLGYSTSVQSSLEYYSECHDEYSVHQTLGYCYYKGERENCGSCRFIEENPSLFIYLLPESELDYKWLLIPFASSALIAGLIFFWFHSYELTVTDKRVYGKVAWGKQVDLPVDLVSAISTVHVLKGVSVSTSSGKISFLAIKNADEIYKVIKDLLIERQQEKPDATVAAVAPKIDETEQLKKYKELLDSGVITQEEFDAKKKQLLGL